MHVHFINLIFNVIMENLIIDIESVNSSMNSSAAALLNI